MANHTAIGKPANAAEKWAFRYLADYLPDPYQLLTNVELYDDRGHPFEVDAIVISEYAVHLIDVKGYQGALVVGKDAWMFNGYSVENPLPKLNNNARILASRCRKKIGHGQHAPWCQAAVFITGGEGGDVQIENFGIDELPVFTKETIIPALVTSEFITCNTPRKLELYQKEIALKALCDFHLLNAKQHTLAGYSKIKQISKINEIETWLVEPIDKSLKFEYWMKLIDLTSCPSNQATHYKSKFKLEYNLLSQLSVIPEVPNALAYWDDGECLALVHSPIEGEVLDNSYISPGMVFDLIYSLALALEKISGEGLVITNLDSKNIYLTSDGILALSNIPDLFKDGANSSLSHQFACIFKPYLFDCKGDEQFSVGSIFKNHEAISFWFQEALDNSDINNDSLSELIDLFFTGNTPRLSTSLDVDNLQVGEVISDKYRLESCLGRGATSIVWRAKHLLGEYECSMKILKDIHGAVDFAKREFDVLRSSFHPNIVRVFDLDVIPNTDTYYLIGQYLNGPTLNELDIDARLWVYFKEILSALQYLHRINVIHKDLKPQNIIVEAGKAYLIDFNLSSIDSLLIGTLSYKDPLVKKNGWSRFSDVYALTVSFVEIASGIHPFHENNEMPTTDLVVALPTQMTGLSSKTRNRLQQVLNHDVDFENIPDYLAWFGISETIDITIPQDVKTKWGIRDGYMTKTLVALLADDQPRSRAVVITNTLKANNIVGNKSAKGSINASISALKNAGIIEGYGKKIKLTSAFKLNLNLYNQ